VADQELAAAGHELAAFDARGVAFGLRAGRFARRIQLHHLIHLRLA
jgi:hypothetical protein